MNIKTFSEMGTLNFKGRKFTSGGARLLVGKHRVTGEKKAFLTAYLGKDKMGNYTITNWKGKPLARNVRSWERNQRDVFGDRLRSVQFHYKGIPFSGVAHGVGGIVKARSVKR